MDEKRVRPPLTDSPWFWLYLFGTAGVLAIAAQSTRYGDRQAQHDRQFQGRQHIYQHAADEESVAAFSTSADKVADLRPLYALLLVVIGAGWTGFLWQRSRERKQLDLADQLLPVIDDGTETGINDRTAAVYSQPRKAPQ
ncbi:MAG: hypothetical protein ACKOU6_21270 [Planctomycetota bacterium]